MDQHGTLTIRGDSSPGVTFLTDDLPKDIDIPGSVSELSACLPNRYRMRGFAKGTEPNEHLVWLIILVY
jgi:hypothetical protein